MDTVYDVLAWLRFYEEGIQGKNMQHNEVNKSEKVCISDEKGNSGRLNAA